MSAASDAERSPVQRSTDVHVRPGIAVLEGIGDGPDLVAHRGRYGDPPRLPLDRLVTILEEVRMRGRGGAAFPFATKLRAAADGARPVLVVNAAEGEPASAKDAALMLRRPHLVLDGALVTARALGAGELHVVVPGDRPHVEQAVRRALAERAGDLRMVVHVAEARFVAGQARAVIELMSGRANLPVTAWGPEAIRGYRGRPTLLSNAETWAQIGRLVLRGSVAFQRLGLPDEPGTTLLTLASTIGRAWVVEAEYGTPLRDVLPPDRHGRPVLVGGFHGTWARWPTMAGATVSVTAMSALETPLGAGVLLSLGRHECPVQLTSHVVEYLAGQSAGRCGPCLHGLPALSAALRDVQHGCGDTRRLEQLTTVVERRGACTHPDGTVRLVRSLMRAFPVELAAHATGRTALCAEALAS